MQTLLPGLIAWLESLLTHFGYPALFVLLVLGIVGLPVPDETLLTFCGYLIYKGRLHAGFTFAAGFLGSAVGITISYALGSRFGNKVARRLGRYVLLTPDRLQKTEQLFRRFGPLLLTIGYFIPGVRHFTAVVAGMSGLRFWRFAVFAYAGAALWVSTFLTLGHTFGERWEHTSAVVHRYTLIGVAGALALAAIFWLVRRLRR